MSLKSVPLAGVIGHPIGHSKSPLMHNHWLRENGIRGHYIPMDVAPEHLERVLRTLPHAGFRGVNVTIPHKERAMEIADTVSDLAQRIGAANTITFSDDGTIHADNTDGYGFLENLRAGAVAWQAESGPAAVLGAGGAARAVIVALLDAGVPEVLLANRTQSRAEGLRGEFGAKVTVIDWSEIHMHLAELGLLVNTTSLGMTGSAPLTINLEGLTSQTVVTDLVYAPLETDLLRVARTRGCDTVDGLGMLLHQGVPGFERWFGTRPTVTDDLRRIMLA